MEAMGVLRTPGLEGIQGAPGGQIEMGPTGGAMQPQGW